MRVHKDIFLSTEYQKKSLQLLVDIKTLLMQLGRTYEPNVSPYHIDQITSKDQLDDIESDLVDHTKKEKVVSFLFLI